MNQKEIIQTVQSRVSVLPHKDHIKRLALFGSVLHQTDNPRSDVDILIELKRPLGYFSLSQIQRTLEEAVKGPVDLVTPHALSKYFRNDVLDEAQTIYES
ncbi:MAG: nucleotidyltransferase domain-containing protein [Candidatus Magasanikbacteria bacterium]|nr:nucleotidyltransferase domain-containing protein [Candidatus Magasanikbacteria bacterium]